MRLITVTGREIDPSRITPFDINLYDIAHGLSNICRFSGQTSSFYSVAQHSVRVAKAVPPDMALMALLHDASEAYLADIPLPVKRLLPDYQKLEDSFTKAIALYFGIPYNLPNTIKLADNRALLTEWLELMPGCPPPYLTGLELLPPEKPMTPDFAFRAFYEMACSLKGI